MDRGRDTCSELAPARRPPRYGLAHPGPPGARRGKDTMNARLRLLLILVVVAIILYFVIAQPDNAAATVRAIISAIGEAIDQIIRFFRGLTA